MNRQAGGTGPGVNSTGGYRLGIIGRAPGVGIGAITGAQKGEAGNQRDDAER